MTLSNFDEIVFVDFEFNVARGDRPTPVCFVALEQRSKRLLRCWLDEWPISPPFAHGPNVAIVAYYASAELGCYLALGWPMPCLILDLYAEFRNATNGLRVPCGNKILGALEYFGLNGISGAAKDTMRARILAGPPYSTEDRKNILDYCESDVQALARLFPRLIPPDQDLRCALLRGRYMYAVACAEYTGVPIDAGMYQRMVADWSNLQTRAIAHVNTSIPVFDGRTFKSARFREWLSRNGIPWPLLPSGSLALDDDTFREMSAKNPIIEPLRQVRQMLGQMRTPDLPIGADGRNRTLLSAFATKTSRNAPSTTRFIFGCPSWMRGLIRPQPGKALAYLDWSQQEFGIAAALSGDTAMQQAYRSGDPYMEFAKLAHAVPAWATKETHPAIRKLFKTTVLGVQYLIGPEGLARRLDVSVAEARDLGARQK